MSEKWILYIGGFEMPDGNAAAQRVTANAKAFRDLGYETFFVGLSRNDQSINIISEFEGWSYLNLKYPSRLIEWLKYLISIRHLETYLNKKPDLIIAYNYPAIALQKLRKWSKHYKIPLIGDSTEWYEATGNFVFRIIKSIDTEYRMKWVHLQLDGLIAISDYLFSFYSAKMRNVVNIPPLVDLSMKKWNLEHHRNDENNKDQINIIYAGSPGGGKKDRLDLVITAFSILVTEGLSNISFRIIGITKDQFINSFNTQIPKNISNSIEFLGRLSHNNTLDEIKLADFYIFFRDRNLTNEAGFPTKFVESLTCGTPVLTNSSSNIEQYIIEGKNGFLIDISDEVILLNGLRKAISCSKEKIAEMKSWCRSSQAFWYKRFSKEFESLLNHL